MSVILVAMMTHALMHHPHVFGHFFLASSGKLVFVGFETVHFASFARSDVGAELLDECRHA